MKPGLLKAETTAIDEVERNRMPLLEHLKELRIRLLWSVGALGVGMAVGLAFAEDVYNFLRAPIMAIFNEAPKNDMDRFYLWLTGPIRSVLPNVHVDGSLNIGNSPLEGMYSWMQVGLISGAVLASPFIAFQIWQFVAPGLYSTEKRWVFPLALSSSFLFISGALFCYAVLFPVTFPFFLTTLDATAVISVQGYLQSVVQMMLGLGLCFQLPIVVWFLAKVGLVDHLDLIRYFRYAIVVIVFVAAVVTPTPDILTQSLLSVPLIGLYIVGIGVAWFSTTKVRTPEAQ
jgi:sec-independent protein translocase protein TatC